MDYELKIDNASEEKGTIDLQRLAHIADGIRRISEGALQIRLKGVSFSKGRKMISLQDAIRVSLIGIRSGSTILQLSTEKFAKTLAPFQTDLFRLESQLDIPEHTPVSLVISSFQEAMSENPDQDVLDKPLLKELEHFKKVFRNDNEVLAISNQGSLPGLELKKQDFKKIKTLEEEIPESETVILNGMVEELKYSKLKVCIKTVKGIVDDFLSPS